MDSGQWLDNITDESAACCPSVNQDNLEKRTVFKREMKITIDPLSCLFYLLICPAQHICEIIRGNRIIIRRKEQTITGDINLSRGS